MAEKNTEQEKAHNLSVRSREHAEISGVTEVESFDEGGVVLSTVCGEVTVEGENLHVSTLDIARGVVVVDGKISGVNYSDAAAPKRGFRSRFFG